jgi:IS30 family transposase
MVVHTIRIRVLVCNRRTPHDANSSRMTRDRGKELVDHRRLTLATNIGVYFCDPQSPWQRGSNETPTVCCSSTAEGD